MEELKNFFASQFLADRFSRYMDILNDRGGYGFAMYGERSRFDYEILKNYIRIIKGGAVFCFVDKMGGILKPAGWKAPAKGARSSILNDSLPLVEGDLYIRR